MADDATLGRINELADEEHRLRRAEADGTAGEADKARLAEVEVLLDQCWDVLRQRRARREFGLDPDEAQARPADEVEGYQQ